jgi:hypothetical protein
MKAKRARTITVVIRDDAYFDIFEGERLVTDLTWDESLGTLAVITHPQLGLSRGTIPPFARLQHIDQFIDRMLYYAERRRMGMVTPQVSPEEAAEWRSSAFYSMPVLSERNDPPALRALDEAIFQRYVSEWRAERYAPTRLLGFQSIFNGVNNGQ